MRVRPCTHRGSAHAERDAGRMWFTEEVREMTIFAEQYDFAITLILLENQTRYQEEIDMMQISTIGSQIAGNALALLRNQRVAKHILHQTASAVEGPR